MKTKKKRLIKGAGLAYRKSCSFDTDLLNGDKCFNTDCHNSENRKRKTKK